MELRGIAMTVTARLAVVGIADGDAAGADEAAGDQSLAQPAQPALVGLEPSRIRRQHEIESTNDPPAESLRTGGRGTAD